MPQRLPPLWAFNLSKPLLGIETFNGSLFPMPSGAFNLSKPLLGIETSNAPKNQLPNWYQIQHKTR